MGKHDQFCDTYFILQVPQRENCGKKWAAYVYLLFRFQVHTFCAPGNPIYSFEHSHKAQEIQQTIRYLLKLSIHYKIRT